MSELLVMPGLSPELGKAMDAIREEFAEKDAKIVRLQVNLDRQRLIARKLEAHVAGLRKCLRDSFDYARHSPGCSGSIVNDAGYQYPCKCGLTDWQKQARDVLGE